MLASGSGRGCSKSLISISTSTFRRASSSKAARLASAASAASEVPPTEGPSPPQVIPIDWIRTGQEIGTEAEEEWNAKERRLSPIGRASQWQAPGGPSMLPPSLREAVDRYISEQGNRTLLKSDLRQKLAGDLDIHTGASGSRQAALHLASNSPQRYAAIQQVLSSTAKRLSSSTPGEPSWKPRRMLDAGCAVGEGGWAASSVWPELEQWSGSDRNPHLLKIGRELFDMDKNADKETASSFASVPSVDFRPARSHRLRPRPKRLEGDELEEVSYNAVDKEETLALSAYQLLSLGSDRAREEHVQSLWKSGAEVITLIEEGTHRGFAAIASARALLLELGAEDKQPSDLADGRERIVLDGVEYFEDVSSKDPDQAEEASAEAPEASGRGCYVVAPCPHDRPCPLLHPFYLSEEYQSVEPTFTTAGPSAHHRGSHLGMSSCLHPVRYLPPRWATDAISEKRRRTREKGGREERSMRMAYVVIKRGDRPTLEASQPTSEVVAALPQARHGIVDDLRRGEPVTRRVAEDIVGEEDPEDVAAREELLKLLPDELRRASLEDADEGSPDQQEDALRLAMANLQGNKEAEDVWKASNDAAETAEEAAEAEGEEETTDQDSSLNQEWLADMLQANQSSEAAETAPPSTSEDIASAVSLLLPSLPRIVLPPIKRGGHVTFDACHSNASIQRYTIAKSSGRQTYQEARKSGWGDLFSQEPVESLQDLEVLDEETGMRSWIKRRGWGQFSRIAPADEEAGITEVTRRSDTKKSRASHRPSALIGADQVCPWRPPPSYRKAAEDWFEDDDEPLGRPSTAPKARRLRDPRSGKTVVVQQRKESRRKQSTAYLRKEAEAELARL